MSEAAHGANMTIAYHQGVVKCCLSSPQKGIGIPSFSLLEQHDPGDYHRNVGKCADQTRGISVVTDEEAHQKIDTQGGVKIPRLLYERCRVLPEQHTVHGRDHRQQN